MNAAHAIECALWILQDAISCRFSFIPNKAVHSLYGELVLVLVYIGHMPLGRTRMPCVNTTSDASRQHDGRSQSAQSQT